MNSIRDGQVQFVIKLYKQVPKKDLTLAEARWYLFSKYQDSNRFLSSADTLKYKILRTQLMFLI